MITRHLGKNAVIVLALVAAGFFVAWLRFRPHLGSEGRYTDGQIAYDVGASDEVRYAVWDEPRGVGGDVNSIEDERRPAISPDGRLLVFVVGERGLGADLFVADLVDGRALDPRPLAALNAEGDEWAPCFAGGALYFASDRLGSSGGLDLWRAAYDRGTFEEPERLAGGLNTAADETDPAPVPGTDALVFASDRRRPGRLTDFDLYLARPRSAGAEPNASDGEWLVEPMDALNSRFDEREPSFTADGRTLFFASDREEGAGGFDLYRSALGRDGWVPPVALAGLNGAADERSPLPTRDGFELYFEVDDSEGADLYRARSIELFRTPGRPVGWLDLLVLGALLVLALLAWLAKRWDAIDVLYKCFLISLVAHLLLLLYFTEVFPEDAEVELRGEGTRMRMRLLAQSNAANAAYEERGGELEVARAEAADAQRDPARQEAAERDVASGAQAAAARAERAAAEALRAPERARGEEPAPSPSTPAAVAVRAEETAFERLAGGAPSVMLDAGETRAPEPRNADGAPSREAAAADVTGALAFEAPRTWTQQRAGGGAELPAAPRAARPELAPPTRDADTSVVVAQPREAFERREAGAPTLSVDDAPAFALGPRAADEARRESTSAPDALDAVVPTAAAGAPLARAGSAAEADVADPLAMRAETSLERSAPSTTDAPLLDQSRERFERLAGDAPALADALPEALAAAAPTARDDGAAPARSASVGAPEPETLAPVAAARLERAELERDVGPPPAFEAARDLPDAEPRGLPSVAVAGPEETAQRFPADTDQPRDLGAELDARLLTVAETMRSARDAGAAPARSTQDSQLETAQLAPSAAASLARADHELEDGPPPSFEAAGDLPAAEPRGLPSVAVAGPEETAQRLSGDAEPRDLGTELDASLLSAAETALPARDDDAAPERSAQDGERQPLELTPSAAARLERSAMASELGAPPSFRAAGDLPPARPRVLPSVAVAAPQETAQRIPAGAVEEERGLAELLDASVLAVAPAARVERVDRLDASAPARFERDRAPALPDAAPGFRPLAAGPARRDDPLPLVATQWEHTPYQSRSGPLKARAIEMHGGSQETEAAVASGLAYLAGRQAAEGFWGDPSDYHEKYRHVSVGKTGLAMLAFLGASHTHQSGSEHSRVVAKAIAFLRAVQDERTGHFGDSSAYSHAIATYALAECHALTGDKALRATLQSATAWILAQQDKRRDPRLFGGWGYYYPDGSTFQNGGRSDTWPRASVTAWQVMALESARLGGIEVPDAAFADARAFLLRAWDAERRAYRYSHDPDRLSGTYSILPGSTPASLFALSLLGEDVTARDYRVARRFVMDRVPDGYRYDGDDEFVHQAVGNMYFWYYGTLAMFRVGGRQWESWNQGMKATLLPSQAPDGSWRPISIYARQYAGDDDGDRVYSTAMSVLTLEIYYRYFTPLLKVE